MSLRDDCDRGPVSSRMLTTPLRRLSNPRFIYFKSDVHQMVLYTASSQTEMYSKYEITATVKRCILCDMICVMEEW